MPDGIAVNPRSARVATGALAVGLVLGVVACGGDGPHDDAPSVDHRIDTRVCAITEVARKHTVGGRSFAELIELPPTEPDLSGTAAAVFLLRDRHHGTLGPYAPVIDHLAALGKVDAEEHRSVPGVSAGVRTSARRLDRALADGLCD